jgi:predicted methyltransferase
MSYLNKIITKWKTEFNVYQKDKQFRNAIKNLPSYQPLNEIQSDEVNFSHSGHLGDIIYSIPTMIKLSEGKKINLYLEINKPNLNFTNKMKHPNGNVMLTEKSIELIAPLILKQKEFNKCEILNNQNKRLSLNNFITKN